MIGLQFNRFAFVQFHSLYKMIVCVYLAVPAPCCRTIIDRQNGANWTTMHCTSSTSHQCCRHGHIIKAKQLQDSTLWGLKPWPVLIGKLTNMSFLRFLVIHVKPLRNIVLLWVRGELNIICSEGISREILSFWIFDH